MRLTFSVDGQVTLLADAPSTVAYCRSPRLAAWHEAATATGVRDWDAAAFHAQTPPLQKHLRSTQAVAPALVASALASLALVSSALVSLELGSSVPASALVSIALTSLALRSLLLMSLFQRD